MLKNRRVLITGACGSIGSALLEYFLKAGAVVCAFDQSEDGLFNLDQVYNPKYQNQLKLFIGNIRDRDRLYRACDNVDIIFHCAAQKHVFLSEYNPFEVVQTNITGVNNIIDCALEQGVGKVIFTSSDKAVNPSSTMGVSKLLGEKLIVAGNNHSGDRGTIFSAVRFGNVLNTNGSVLRIFKKQLSQNLPITITSKQMTRYFITMMEAVKLCVHCFNNMIGGEIFISKMDSFKIIDLAKALNVEGELKTKIIGLKPGEKLYEELITDEESNRTIFKEGYYILLPSSIDIMSEKIKSKYIAYENMEKIGSSMNSHKDNISVEDIFKLLRENSFV